MKTDLRLTDTNAASDSKGRTWGLEGSLFWWLVGGVGAGITLFFVLIVGLKARLLTSFVVALVPVLLCLAYIFGLRQGKPPGYDRDCFERWFRQRLRPEIDTRFAHPLAKTAMDTSNPCNSTPPIRLAGKPPSHDLDPTARAHMERASPHQEASSH